MNKVFRLALWFVIVLAFACNRDEELVLSDQANLVHLSVAYQGNIYTTSITNSAIALLAPLPFHAEYVTIKSLQASPMARTNRYSGDTLWVNRGLVHIEVIAENNQNKKIYSLPLEVADEPDYAQLLFDIPSATNCDHYATISIGDWKVENNVWNTTGLTNGSYSQCIYTYEDASLQLLGWQWQYPDNAFGVNAYPQLIYGWKPWLPPSTTSNLPKRIADIQHLKVTYDVEVSRNEGDYNLAFDNWINSSENITPQNILFEFMIWEDANNLVPFGDYQEDVVTSNGTYRFYMGDPTWEPPGSDWTYLAFQRIGNRSQGTVDIDELLAYLVTKGIVAPTHYLSSIELGNEVGNSSGHAIIKAFQVELN
ncbi:MAG: hypothetical protein ACFB10_19485 [Salibacteraceae bacterium]